MRVLLYLLLQFLLAVFLVLMYYKFVEFRKVKKLNKNNIPTDLKLFIYMEKIDVKKIKYNKLMKIVAVVNAIDIGLVLVATNIVNNIILKFLLAIPLIFILLFSSYKLVGSILKKKGMTLNES